MGVCLGNGHFVQKSKLKRPAKIFCEAHNFVPRRNFDKRFVVGKAWDAEAEDRGIAPVNRTTRALLAHTYGINLFIYACSAMLKYCNYTTSLHIRPP
jgi:hypothetical protein